MATYASRCIENEILMFLRKTSKLRLEVSLDDILAVFHRFSDSVTCERIEGSDEFDYLIYFTSGVPDGFRYCIKLEDDGCASYHRFIREDYEAFGF